MIVLPLVIHTTPEHGDLKTIAPGLHPEAARAMALSLPVMAQDEPPLEAIPVSGTFNYTPEIFVEAPSETTVFFDAAEDEVWSGDIAGQPLLRSAWSSALTTDFQIHSENISSIPSAQPTDLCLG